MSGASVETDNGEVFFCLYFDLFPNKTADLEVISRAAIEFVAAIKEVAYIFAPDIEIRVELESGTEGSLSLNSVIKSKTVGKILDPVIRKAMLGSILTWLALGPAEKIRDHGVDYIWNHIFGTETDQNCSMSAEDMKKAIERAVAIQSKGVARQHLRKFYGEVGKDEAVRGVGGSAIKGEPPLAIIPRSNFSSLAGHNAEAIETQAQTKTFRETEDVTLISPVLDPESTKRYWVIRTSHGDAGFSMDDKGFLGRLHDGRLGTPLRSGIKLNVTYSITEQITSSGKLHVKRRIEAVHHVILPRHESLLPSGEKGVNEE